MKKPITLPRIWRCSMVPAAEGETMSGCSRGNDEYQSGFWLFTLRNNHNFECASFAAVVVVHSARTQRSVLYLDGDENYDG